jgi:hypothetical protein
MKKFGILLMLLSAAVLASAQQGFDFRNTAGFVSDPAGNTVVLPTTAYPAQANGLTFGWVDTSLVQGRDRSTSVDPRLAGINFATNGQPATFYVDLPSPGIYKLSLAMGDAGWEECWVGCQIQFFDSSNLVGTISRGLIQCNYFYDAQGASWSAQAWPASTATLQVSLSGTRLTMVVGTQVSGDYTPIAFLGITSASPPSFGITSTFTVAQGTQIGPYAFRLTASNGWNGDVSMSALNVPAGTRVTFNPAIVAGGNDTTAVTINVGPNTPPGFYPIVVLGDGGSLQGTALVALRVTQ